MSHRSTALDLPSYFITDHEPHEARRRFAAMVRALAQLSAGARVPQHAHAPAESDDVLPTRRVNRIRRLLGRLPKPGKSRSHARRLR